MTDKSTITVLDGAVTLKQHKNGFRTCMDSVLLAAACPAEKGDSILDLGCGVGSAGLCLLHRISDTHLTGLDIQPECIEIAHENAKVNQLPERCVFKYADVQNLDEEGFDHVICNPPFEDSGSHMNSPKDSRALAIGHNDPNLDLQKWIKASLRSVKSGGTLTLIHKADQTQNILQYLGKSWGATEIIPLWPKKDREAKRVIVRTIKDRKSPCRIHPGLILHNNDGTYTDAAENILRHGHKL